MNESIWNFNDHILLNFEFGMLACEMRMASDDISTFNGDKEWHSEFEWGRIFQGFSGVVGCAWMTEISMRFGRIARWFASRTTQTVSACFDFTYHPEIPTKSLLKRQQTLPSKQHLTIDYM